MIHTCSLCVKCRIWGVPRPYRGCLDTFMWLFYHFVEFYGLKHPKISQEIMMVWTKILRLSQNVIHICSLYVKYRIWGVARPYRGCSDTFMWLFYHFVRFYCLKHPKNVTGDHDGLNQNIEFTNTLDHLLLVHSCD